MAVTRGSKRGDRLSLPWDLSEWADPGQLLGWIVKEVEALDWSNPELVAYLQAHPEYQPKMLLCLLTYAYATGFYESDELARACFQEPRLRALCGGHEPSAKSLVRFRRENRGLLKWSLMQLFRRVVQARFDLGEALFPAGLKRDLVDAAVMRLDLARTMDRAPL